MQDPFIIAAITEINLIFILLNPELKLTLNEFQLLYTVILPLFMVSSKKKNLRYKRMEIFHQCFQ